MEINLPLFSVVTQKEAMKNKKGGKNGESDKGREKEERKKYKISY